MADPDARELAEGYWPDLSGPERPMTEQELRDALARLDMDAVTAAVQSAPWPDEDAAVAQAERDAGDREADEQRLLDEYGYGGFPGDPRFT